VNTGQTADESEIWLWQVNKNRVSGQSGTRAWPSVMSQAHIKRRGNTHDYNTRLEELKSETRFTH